MANFNWTCPYCDRDQTVTQGRVSNIDSPFRMAAGQEGNVGLTGSSIVCANEACNKSTVSVTLYKWSVNGSGDYRRLPNSAIKTTRLMPDAGGKLQPDYIPVAIRDDYREACLIRDLSPKASATLTRRCLQGMIRHFCNISGKTLYQEINALKAAVDAGTVSRDVSAESVDAIDNVRKVGNIGAHMEANVEHIIPVDPQEAQLLIELVENLFEEWYVAQHKRRARFARVAEVAASKEALIAAGARPQRLLPSVDE